MRLPKEFVITAKYLLIVSAVFLALYFGGRAIIGLVVYSPPSEGVMEIGLDFSEDTVYLVELPSFGLLRGISIEGSFSGVGRAIVHAEIGNQSILVFDSNTLSKTEEKAKGAPSMLTGYVVAEGSEPSPAETGASEQPSNEGTRESEASSPPVAETSEGEETSQETTEPITENEQPEVSEETPEEMPPETPESPSEGLPENITEEEIPPVQTNESGEIALPELNLTEPPTGSQGKETEPAQGEPPISAEIPFKRSCIDSCSINLTASAIKLVISITGGAQLHIGKLYYNLAEVKELTPPMLLKPIPDIIIEQNRSFSLIITDYFSGGELSLSVTPHDKIQSFASKSRVYFVPETGWKGSARFRINASNEKGWALSNEFSISVKPVEEELLLDRLKRLFPHIAFIEVAQSNRAFTLVYEVNNTYVRISGLKNLSDIEGISVGEVSVIKI